MTDRKYLVNEKQKDEDNQELMTVNNNFISALWIGFLIGALPWTFLITFTNISEEYNQQYQTEENITLAAVSIEAPLGRLGNLIFQYAALIGVASKLKMVPLLPPGTELRRVFKGLSAFTVQYHKPFLEDRIIYQETNAGAFESEILKMKKKDFLIGGYFQSWKYFAHVQKKIRNELQFSDEIQEKAYKFMRKKVKNIENSTIIGIHVRKTDYDSAMPQKVGFRSAHGSYILNALDYYRKLFKNAVFIACSDDQRYIAEFFADETDVFLSTNQKPEVDLAILSSCNHTIQTVGSFGWWGAFLSGGMSVYFKDWTIPGSQADKWYNREDYYLPSWKGLP